MKKIKIKGYIIPNDYKWIYDFFEVDSTCPADVEKALNEANGEDVEVDINSPGGDMYSGSEIYTLLMGYSGKVVTNGVGVVASAASLPLVAGRPARISPTAQLMIHNVMSEPLGDYRVHEHEAKVLKGHNVSVANAYRLKTGLSEEKLLELMDAGGSANMGTYLNAQQALELGFVDEIMFDEGNRLVACANYGPLFSPQVINKLRNILLPVLKQEEENQSRDDNQEKALLQARLNLLKIRRKVH